MEIRWREDQAAAAAISSNKAIHECTYKPTISINTRTTGNTVERASETEEAR